MSPTISSRHLTLCLLPLLVACGDAGSGGTSGSSQPATSTAKAASSGKPSAAPPEKSAAPVPRSGSSAEPAASGAPKAGPFSKASVPAGDLDGISTRAYGVERFPSDTDKNYLEAGLFCHEQKKTLCTATQWKRAVAVDASLGATETWTASFDGNKGIVIGGADANARATDPKSHDASRAAVCCDLAPGFKLGKNTDKTFQDIAQKDFIAYADALEKQDIGALDKIYGPGLFMEQMSEGIAHDATMQSQRGWFTTHPKLWTVYDTCTADLGKVPAMEGGKSLETDGVLVTCQVAVGLEKEVTLATQEIGWFRFSGESKNVLTYIKHAKRETVKF